jgi:hypothetical protein
MLMKNILKIYLMLMSAVLVTSCLEDETAPLDPSGSQNVIEFFDPSVPSSPAGAIYPAWTTAFSVSPEAQFEQVISYSGPNPNDKDINLTLEIDPIALEDFNEQMAALGSSTYEVLPAENYSIPSMTVTIPKGQTRITIPITVYPDQFDLSRSFAIPLRIASASSGIISEHYSVAILATVVKNKYDGIYTVEGSMIDVTNADFVGIYPKTVELRTVDGTTVNYYDRGEALAGHLFLNKATGGGTYWGGFLAQFKFDGVAGATNEIVSVVNALGQGNNNRSGKLDPAAGAKHVFTFEADGVTPKTMEVWYIMRQENTSTDRAFWKETYTYVGPRD